MNLYNIKNGTYFVTGIDTDAGKSYATAIIARELIQSGRSVITQKFIQTGTDDTPGTISEDIMTHRRIMGIPLQEVDLDGTTCPETFRFPSSPDLAARLENRTVDLAKIAASTEILEKAYDIVLIEGAGGLLVPLNGEYTTADYITDHNLPVMLVTSPRLGSVNHTLLTLEVCRNRGIELAGVIYNRFPETNKTLENDTFDYICRYVRRHHPRTEIYETPTIA